MNVLKNQAEIEQIFKPYNCQNLFFAFFKFNFENNFKPKGAQWSGSMRFRLLIKSVAFTDIISA